MFFIPMFVPTLVLGTLWIGSAIWLYLKYEYEMNEAEQKSLWGSVLGNGGWMWGLWCLSACISAAAFISSWVMLVGVQGAGSAQGEWGSSYTFILPCILVLQNAYNLIMMVNQSTEMEWLVCVLLWAAVACYGWLWVACWTLFPSAIWLHVLNTVLWLHGVVWDAGVWFVSWAYNNSNNHSLNAEKQDEETEGMISKG